jgi:hypothetical protein
MKNVGIVPSPLVSHKTDLEIASADSRLWIDILSLCDRFAPWTIFLFNGMKGTYTIL